MPYGLWPAGFEVDRRKVCLYLLNSNHPRGGAKAKFFIGVGFQPDEVWHLQDALCGHAVMANYRGITVAPFGLRYLFEGPFATARGGMRKLRSVWQLDTENAGAAKFVTAIPL
ncbi:DUF6883 domain-containing protein [Methylobacterium brachiatum]|uniref:DUF6883 domain-containing protein n=1 Tax=Methylobacterium brachiatum TaxID=269660 RepID=UPI000EFB31D9|nr:DUF6883 domain-containing protein [Methylobacterium brachiatum]AYO81238.1 hypothetical protein EBB05_02360 [Methylobacterium brachiatum]